MLRVWGFRGLGNRGYGLRRFRVEVYGLGLEVYP